MRWFHRQPNRGSGVIAELAVVVVAVQVIAVVAVGTALQIAVACWSDRTTSEQGGEDRKNENVFHVRCSFGSDPKTKASNERAPPRHTAMPAKPADA
jgi:hypothetical protein